MRSVPRLALAVALAVAGVNGATAQTAPAATGPLAPTVTVVNAEEREIVERAVVTGTLVPREEVLVAPEIEGPRITEVLVEEGAVVTQGQVLARLSRDILETQLSQNAASLSRAEAAIAQARSQIMQSEAAQVEAKAALDRTRALMRGGKTTEAVLEQRVSAARVAEGGLAASRDQLGIAEADRAAALAQRQELEVRLARTEIKAPAPGIVSRKTARVGATATGAAEPLFRIIAHGEIELEGEVTELQLPRIREGAPAEIAIDAGRSIAGRVRNVLPEVDRATRLGKVRIALPKNAGLRIGSFARGSVEIARRTGVAVPISSVMYGAGGATVLAVVEDRVQARRIQPGLSAGGLVQVTEGIAAGERVVARAGSFLRDGDVVRPVLREGGARRTAQHGSAR